MAHWGSSDAQDENPYGMDYDGNADGEADGPGGVEEDTLDVRDHWEEGSLESLQSPAKEVRERGKERAGERVWSIDADAPVVEGGVDVIGGQGVRIEGRIKKKKHKKKSLNNTD